LLRIAAHIREWQHRQRGLVGQGERGGNRRIGRRSFAVILLCRDRPDIAVAAARQRLNPFFAAGFLREDAPQRRDLNG